MTSTWKINIATSSDFNSQIWDRTKANLSQWVSENAQPCLYPIDKEVTIVWKISSIFNCHFAISSNEEIKIKIKYWQYKQQPRPSVFFLSVNKPGFELTVSDCHICCKNSSKRKSGPQPTAALFRRMNEFTLDKGLDWLSLFWQHMSTQGPSNQRHHIKIQFFHLRQKKWKCDDVVRRQKSSFISIQKTLC